MIYTSSRIFKAGYAHEEAPDDFIYHGVDTLSEVLVRDISKEEQSHILLYQKEIRDKVQHYRSMELDIQENMVMEREDKEAQATKDSPIATNCAADKGKCPME